jgi:VWFA-related protein
MKSTLRLILALFAAACFLFAAVSLLSAQEPIPAPKPAPASTTDIHLAVVVDAKHDQPVEQVLPESAFTLLDNGVSRPIKSFRHVASDAPVRVLIVIDAVNAGYTTVAYERQELEKFLSANNGQLARPTALAILTDKGLQIQPASTRDGKAIMAALDAQTSSLRIIGRGAGFYGAEERLDISLNTLRTLIAKESEVPGRKLIVFVSPGWALLSGPHIELSGKQQQGIFEHIAELTNRLQQANITLYAVDPRGNSQPIQSRFYYQEFLKGVSKPQQADIADLSLQVLATHSGGLVLNSNNNIDELVKRAVDDAAQYYELTFTPAPGDQPNEYHSLEIKLAQPGLTARTQQAYYAQP